MSGLELFCDIDDVMMSVAPHLKATQIATGKQRQRLGQLWPSEIMAMLIHVHQSQYRTFKAYSTEHVHVYLSSEFPHLVRYPRFGALIPRLLLPLLAYLQNRSRASTGISFIGSTSLVVCDPKRIHQHRVFAADARRGKSSMGWFFGFKLHLRGTLIGDRGSMSALLTALLFEQGLQLMTRLRKNMKNHLMHLSETLLVRTRAIIELISDQLKHISPSEHSRHRSPTNVVVHLIAELLASSHQAKKPGLHLDQRLFLVA